jgi:signal transduction histidine kinase
MRHFLTLGLLFLNFFAMSQGADYHMMEKMLETDTLKFEDRIEILNVLSRDFAYVNSRKSVEYAEEALTLSLEKNYLLGEAYAYRNLASAYFLQEYFFSGYEFVEKAIVLFELQGDSIGIANCYITLGNFFRRQLFYAKAAEYQQKAADIFSRINNPERLAVAIHNLADNQFRMGLSTEARGNFYKALRIIKGYNYQLLISSCHRGLGLVALQEGNIEEAEKYLLLVIEFANKMGENAQKEATIETYSALATIAQQRGESAKELEYLTNALELAKVYVYPRVLQQAYLELMGYHIRQGNNATSYNLLKEYIKEQNRLDTLQISDWYELAETSLTMQRVKQQNEVLMRETLQKNQELALQKNRNGFLVITMGLLVIFLAILLYLNRKNRKFNQLLEAQNWVIEEKSAKLEASNEAKSKFFSIVSHDIKSPLNSLKGFVSLLKNHHASMKPEELDKFLDDLEKSLQNTLDLADHLILWAKSQMDQLPFQRDAHEIGPIIQNTLQLFEKQLNDKSLRVVQVGLDDPSVVMGDIESLHFIVRNLFHNALKFSPLGSTIQIYTHANGDFLEMQLTNEGEKIPENQISQIFKPGTGHSTKGTAGEKGTGLGLVLVKEFIEKNSGTIRVENGKEQGVTFTVTLPLAEK